MNTVAIAIVCAIVGAVLGALAWPALLNWIASRLEEL